jgi:glutamate/tyrosine decarboxylase-like PLP-dependent enzyme
MTSMSQRGRSVDDVLDDLAARQAREPDPHGARLFGLVYPTHRAELERLAEEVTRRYLFGNALNPFRYPELAQLEREVVAMTSALVHRDDATGGGTMTSGGTESILMSMLVNRERARARGVERPQILAARTAHPAYAKAAHYFDMELVRMPVDDRWRADPEAAAALVTDRTAVIVASAFTYPHGVMDPVTELAAIAASHGVGCHVDACIGAFVLPFLERLGHDVPPWDFRVAGVTEMSADVHKYGYCPKGASVVLHRDDDWFAHQVFLFEDWPSGLYGSPGVAGARPAAPVAAAWAVMTHLGIDGYLELARILVDTTATVRAAVAELADVEVVGYPVGPVLALESSTVDLYAVADVLDDRGWYVNRNVEPHGLHMMLSPAHADVVDQLVADLRDAVGRHGPSRGVEARYS